MEAAVSKSSVHRMQQQNKINSQETKCVQLQFHSGDEGWFLQFCEWALHIIIAII